MITELKEPFEYLSKVLQAEATAIAKAFRWGVPLRSVSGAAGDQPDWNRVGKGRREGRGVMSRETLSGVFKLYWAETWGPVDVWDLHTQGLWFRAETWAFK